jgi:hypothetical protein
MEVILLYLKNLSIKHAFPITILEESLVPTSQVEKALWKNFSCFDFSISNFNARPFYPNLVDESNTNQWHGSDRDYTYDELLNRVFEIILEKNPDMAAGRKPKFVMRPPQVLRVGTKKTSFANFTEICKTLHRQPKHLLDFLLAELGTSGSVDGNSQLIIKGRFQSKQIENVLRRWENCEFENLI